MTGHLPEHLAPAGVSPAIADVWTAYFQAFARGESDGASDAVTDIAVQEMAVAASQLAAMPCRSLPDLAAKAQLVLYAQDEIGGLTSAEDAVRTSVLAAVLVMVEETA